MILIIEKPANPKQIKKMAEDFDGYIKVVVDIEEEILTGGGESHVDAEQELLKHGSKQINLWGGGVDAETKEIDYNSIINLRPNQDNPSRDVLSREIRKKFDKIVRELLF